MDTQTATLTGNGLSLTRTKAPGTKTWPNPAGADPRPQNVLRTYSRAILMIRSAALARRNTVYPSTFRDGEGAPMSRRQDGSTDTLTGGLLRAAAVSGLVTGLAAAAVGGAGAATASCLSLGGFFSIGSGCTSTPLSFALVLGNGTANARGLLTGAVAIGNASFADARIPHLRHCERPGQYRTRSGSPAD
jgi:hypothetical protein